MLFYYYNGDGDYDDCDNGFSDHDKDFYDHDHHYDQNHDDIPPSKLSQYMLWTLYVKVIWTSHLIVQRVR